MLEQAATQDIPDVREAVQDAKLVYVTDSDPGISRLRAGKGFRYLGPRGGKIDDEASISRIKALAIPPAWSDVWICTKANGHLQATGRDARGRKQYRYHARFREVRDGAKYHRMLGFAECLPLIRSKVRQHLSLAGLPREKVMATVVHLLETTLIRVGSDEYARTNKSYGLTTMKNRHVDVEGSALRFNFRGKSGKVWRLQVRDRRVAKVIRACQELPGQELFQYIDGDGDVRDITSSDVNEYLRHVCGKNITAKDFRTWHGTVLAAMVLQESEKCGSEASAKKNIRDAIQSVASRLGNTSAVCRKCYVHPEILASYAEGTLALQVKKRVEAELRDDLPDLKPEEAAVLTLLRTRLSTSLKDKLNASLSA